MSLVLPTAEYGVTVSTELEGDGQVACVPEEFNQVLTNLIENAIDALNILEVDRFDVIIVDQQLPELSGLEFVRELRERGISAKVIVVAAVLPSDVRLGYEQMGVEIIFSKPFDVLQLRSAVDSLVA